MIAIRAVQFQISSNYLSKIYLPGVNAIKYFGLNNFKANENHDKVQLNYMNFDGNMVLYY